MKKEITIHRTRIGSDIVAEFAVPATKESQKQKRVLIVAHGMPTLPGAEDLVTFFAEKGFYVVSPSYRGSWESSGVFLKNEPNEDIRDVVETMAKGPSLVSLWEGKNYRFPKRPHIYLLGASFGGPAVLLLSAHPLVSKVFAFSPVVDWTKESKGEPLDWLYSLVQSAYGEGYRMNLKDWEKLKKGSFYNPATKQAQVVGEKVVLFHTKDDDIVLWEPVRAFAEAVGAKLYLSEKGGHVRTKSITNARTWQKMARCMNR